MLTVRSTSSLTLFLLASACGSTTSGDHHAAAAGAVYPSTSTRGQELFDAHCAVCHGVEGGGDGFASPYLFPAARDFTRGRFRLVSTTNGAPTREDLERTIRRGVPGSAMPAWHWLSEDDVTELAEHVRTLAVEGVALELLLDAAVDGTRTSDEEARAEARRRLTPDEVLPEVAEVDPTPALLARGEELYGALCASCHGADGSGRREPRFDDDGNLNWARDFTAGYLKGGRSARALGWRIQAGLPGTAMPPTVLAQDELEALVAHLHTLAPPSAESRFVHHRGRILVRRVETLPADPSDPCWSDFEETPVVLAPLRATRRGRAVMQAFVAARHDGERIALRVRWPDESADHRILSDLGAPDACAVQLSEAEVPVLFGMGSREHPTIIWHWRALRIEEVDGSQDLLERVPHGFAPTVPGEVRLDVPLYRPSASTPPMSRTVESFEARGIGDIDRGRGLLDTVTSTPVRGAQEWQVLFTSALAPAAGEQLVPGARAHLALAVWNGAIGDRGPQKSISIWQALELER